MGIRLCQRFNSKLFSTRARLTRLRVERQGLVYKIGQNSVDTQLDTETWKELIQMTLRAGKENCSNPKEGSTAAKTGVKTKSRTIRLLLGNREQFLRFLVL